MKVKCIDNEDWIEALTMGKTYEVLFEWSTGYRILCDDNQTYFVAKDRFEIVEKEDNNMENTNNKFYNIDIFNWEDFKNGKIAVLCNTEELAKDFLDKCDEQGVTLGTSVINNGIYSVLFGNYNLRWYQSSNIKVIQWEIKNNEIEKTFQEVFKGWEIIKMCEEGKIKNGTILQDLDGEHFTVFNGVIIDGERENFDSNYETTSSFFVRNKFRIIKKKYTFEEAFKAYEEGKEIESCYSGVTYKLQHGGSDCFGGGQKTSTIAFNEIRGKWYIND